MKKTGIVLILLSLSGIIAVLIYKYIKKTVIFIGPKSFTAFIICGILIVIGMRLLLGNKNNKGIKNN
jgi:hypothetical protein